MKNNSEIKFVSLCAEALYGNLEAGGIDVCKNNVLTLKGILSQNKNTFTELENPLWPFDAKSKTIDLIADKLGLCSDMRNLIKLLSQQKKIHLLEKVLTEFMTLYYKKHDIAQVRVSTVIELSNEQDRLLKNKLSKIFKQNVMVEYVIDPKILGGLVIQCGTHLIDSSIKNKLNTLEQYMKGMK